MRELQHQKQRVIGQGPAEIEAAGWKYRLVVVLIAACIVLSFVSSAFGSQILQEVFFLGLVIPVALQAMFNMVKLRSAVTTLGFAVPYLVALWTSLFTNIGQDRNLFFNLVVLTNVSLAFLLFSLALSKLSTKMADDVMKAVFLLALPLFGYVIATVPSYVGSWGRWMPLGQHPNWWGMTALGLAWAAFAFRHAAVRFIGLSVAIYVMVQVQSRGALLALVPALAISSGFFRPFVGKRIAQLGVLMLIGGIAVILLSAISPSVDAAQQKVINYLLNDVAKLNDPYRGLDSGLTGRTSAYEAAWKAFLESPIVGTGFGSMEFVHNGFLLVLAESGLLGGIGLMFLFIWSLVRASRSRDWNAIGYILSYIFVIMTFPRSININLTSLLCIMIMMKQASRVRDGAGFSIR
jgi:O-antigen ligase